MDKEQFKLTERGLWWLKINLANDTLRFAADNKVNAYKKAYIYLKNGGK